jgi:hypothetical protein
MSSFCAIVYLLACISTLGAMRMSTEELDEAVIGTRRLRVGAWLLLTLKEFSFTLGLYQGPGVPFYFELPILLLATADIVAFTLIVCKRLHPAISDFENIQPFHYDSGILGKDRGSDNGFGPK